MAARKPGLGRGLDALIPVDRSETGFSTIPLERVDANPLQPRKHFDAASIEQLSASIREVGVLQPIVVRGVEDTGRYALIAGERRCRAARLAGLSDIPAVIRGEDEGAGVLAEALIENVQREDLSPLEEAAGYRQLIEDFGLKHEEVAQRVGKSRSAVSNLLRLLQLPAAVQGMLDRKELTAGHARALLSLEDEAYAVNIARKAGAEGWSVRQVEDAVRLRIEGADAKTTPRTLPKVRPAAIIELESRLAEHLDTKVNIDYGDRGGKLVVRFASLDDLERIYRKFYRHT